MATIRQRFSDARGQERSPAHRLVIAPGTIRDYDALGVWHYRAGRPATFVRVLTATDPLDPWGERVAGVLVVSMPTINGAWRGAAWGDDYARGDKRDNLARLNEQVRCLSRVVVRPCWRGMGVAVGLVRAYLDAPLSPRTEAVAAMGHLCPFFEHAGMRRVECPISDSTQRLVARFEQAGVRPWDLACAGVRRRVWRDRALRGAIDAWARSGRGRGGVSGEHLVLRAYAAIGAPRAAFVHG